MPIHTESAKWPTFSIDCCGGKAVGSKRLPVHRARPERLHIATCSITQKQVPATYNVSEILPLPLAATRAGVTFSTQLRRLYVPYAMRILKHEDMIPIGAPTEFHWRSRLLPVCTFGESFCTPLGRFIWLGERVAASI